MLLQPTEPDIWVSTQLAKLVGSHPLFDLCVQSAVRHNILGGYAYAFALFALWVRGTRLGQEESRRRVLTTLFGSAVAILLTILGSALMSWPPPSRHPALAALYPDYLDLNPNTNSFPSQSTALYTAVAAGIYSRQKLLGIILWVGVAVVVALPRMYVGGHYLTDVLAGLILGLAGYISTRHLLDRWLVLRADRVFANGGRGWLVGQLLVFGWISQVATEFRDVVWLESSLESLLNYFFSS